MTYSSDPQLGTALGDGGYGEQKLVGSMFRYTDLDLRTCWSQLIMASPRARVTVSCKLVLAYRPPPVHMGLSWTLYRSVLVRIRSAFSLVIPANNTKLAVKLINCQSNRFALKTKSTL